MFGTLPTRTVPRTLLSFLALLVLAASSAGAANVLVNTTNDEQDFSCMDGDCSLRDAIFSATSGDTILIPAGTYTLTLASNVLVDKDLTLQGSSAATTIVQADVTPDTAANRVLLIATGKVDLVDLTIRHGAGADVGGGILSSGQLTITDCVITENRANNQGGGIFTSTELTIVNSTISNNIAGGNDADNRGGGIAMGADKLDITSSVISGNGAIRGTDEMDPGTGSGGGVSLSGSDAKFLDTDIVGNSAEDTAGGILVLGGTADLVETTVDDNMAGTHGGGLYNLASGEVTIDASTFSNNSAGGDGGALQSDTGTVDLVNSTLSGNSADGNGGAALNIATMTFSNVTITNNTADADMNDSGQGGGVHGSPFGGDTTVFRNTILAGNSNPCPTCTQAPDCRTPSTAFTSDGYNLVGDASQCSGFDPLGSTDDQVGGVLNPVIDAMLDALADNGGPTLTHALDDTSPAFDAGNPSGCVDAAMVLLDEDQRGEPRPLGTACEVGSFEYDAPPPPPMLPFTDGFETGDTSAWSLTQDE